MYLNIAHLARLIGLPLPNPILVLKIPATTVRVRLERNHISVDTYSLTALKEEKGYFCFSVEDLNL
jgi:hypothetical protein